MTAIPAKNLSAADEVLRTHGLFRSIAQSVERTTDNREVESSTLSTPTIKLNMGQ